MIPVAGRGAKQTGVSTTGLGAKGNRITHCPLYSAFKFIRCTASTNITKHIGVLLRSLTNPFNFICTVAVTIATAVAATGGPADTPAQTAPAFAAGTIQHVHKVEHLEGQEQKATATSAYWRGAMDTRAFSQQQQRQHHASVKNKMDLPQKKIVQAAQLKRQGRGRRERRKIE